VLKQSDDVLSARALNRASLERQLLLRRSDFAPARIIEWLVGMQAQATTPPYFGLWSRLERFTRDDLSRLIQEREVVRAPLMRATIHMVTARDFQAFNPLLQPVLTRMFFSGSPYGRQVKDIDIDAVLAASRTLITEKPRTNTELGNLLRESWPGYDAKSLGSAVQFLVPVVQVPPRGVWGVGGKSAWTTAESWLGQPINSGAPLDDMVQRYLAAYGPATVMDIQSWCGLTRLGEVVERLRPGLCTFRNEKGKELFDLPDAPRPHPDTPAPVRFLGEYDNALLGYADRARWIDEAHSKNALFTNSGSLHGTALIGGFVRATWIIKQEKTQANLEIQPFLRLSKAQREEVEEEGLRLLDFAVPGGGRSGVTFLPPES
jgi:winged helix DNA-binding protein